MRAALVLLLALSPAVAAGSQQLTLSQVLRSVARLHPVNAEARAKLRAARGKVASNVGFFDPLLAAKGDYTPHGDFQIGKANVELRQRTALWGLTLIGGWRLGRGDFPEYKKEQATSAGGQAHLGIELPLLRGGAIDQGRAKLRSSRRLTLAAEFAVAAIALELSRRAAHRYWAWVAAGRRLGIARNLLRIARTRVAQIDSQIRRGALAPIEALDNQRAILKREGAVIKAQRAFEKLALKLSLYLRDDKGNPRIPKASELPPQIAQPKLPPGSRLSADVRQALLKRPELGQLRARRGAVEVARALARNQRLPMVNLTARAGYDLGSEPYETRRGEVLFGLSFSFPLLNRAALGAIEAASGQIGAIDQKSRWIADKIATQVRNAHSAIRAAQRSLGVARREVAVAHRVEAAERERLRLGASTLLTVNLREQAAAEAQIRAVDAAATLQRAAADYRAFIGRMSE